MAAGADPAITNKAGHDAAFEAEEAERNEVVGWLLNACKEEPVAEDVDALEDGREKGSEEIESGLKKVDLSGKP